MRGANDGRGQWKPIDTNVSEQKTSSQRTKQQRFIERRQEDDSDDQENFKTIENLSMMDEHHEGDESEEEVNTTGDQSTMRTSVQRLQSAP